MFPKTQWNNQPNILLQSTETNMWIQLQTNKIDWILMNIGVLLVVGGELSCRQTVSLGSSLIQHNNSLMSM